MGYDLACGMMLGDGFENFLAKALLNISARSVSTIVMYSYHQLQSNCDSLPFFMWCPLYRLFDVFEFQVQRFDSQQTIA